MEPRTNQLTPPQRRAPGMALVIVLAFLALLTVLIVAFLSGVTSDYSASQSYAKGATARSLGEQAVQLAMGQIKKATTGTEIAWASQPGMIRTWDRTGAKAAFYKLYSSDSMELTSGLDSYQPESDVAPDWQSRPALFSDLNAPVATGAGNHYPILDGNDLQQLTFEGASIQTYTFGTTAGLPEVAVTTSPVFGLPGPAVIPERRTVCSGASSSRERLAGASSVGGNGLPTATANVCVAVNAPSDTFTATSAEPVLPDPGTSSKEPVASGDV
jgi:hypothetical protein